jgi:ribokinase
VLGDLALDIVVTAAANIATGSDVSGTISFRVGGSAANVARSFAALGAEAVFIGAIGDDRLGRRLARGLRQAGVRARLTVAVGRSSPRLLVLLGPDGERSFVTARGAADWLAPTDLRRRWFRRAGALHLPAYSLLNEPLSAAALLAAELAHAAGGLVSVDLASAEPLRAAGAESVRQQLAGVGPDIVFGNEAEAEAVGGLAGLAPLVVLKRGAAGCRVGDVDVTTQPLPADDTTGAGDAFDAGFLHALLLRPSVAPQAAARAGHRAAAALLSAPRPELAL